MGILVRSWIDLLLVQEEDLLLVREEDLLLVQDEDLLLVHEEDLLPVSLKNKNHDYCVVTAQES